MIDYLERLFAVEMPREEEKPELDLRFSLSGELPEGLPRPALATEETAQVPVPTLSEEQYWQQEGVRRVEQALSEIPVRPRLSGYAPPEEMSGAHRTRSVPEELARVQPVSEEPVFTAWEPAAVTAAREADPGEGLERRLRRDSRRYDSGFFWY